MTTPDSILAPACKALFGGTPSQLGIALSRNGSRHLRSTYNRHVARAMFDARVSGDLARCEAAAAAAMRVVDGDLPVSA